MDWLEEKVGSPLRTWITEKIQANSERFFKEEAERKLREGEMQRKLEASYDPPYMTPILMSGLKDRLMNMPGLRGPARAAGMPRPGMPPAMAEELPWGSAE